MWTNDGSYNVNCTDKYFEQEKIKGYKKHVCHLALELSYYNYGCSLVNTCYTLLNK